MQFIWQEEPFFCMVAVSRYIQTVFLQVFVRGSSCYIKQKEQNQTGAIEFILTALSNILVSLCRTKTKDKILNFSSISIQMP